MFSRSCGGSDDDLGHRAVASENEPFTTGPSNHLSDDPKCATTGGLEGNHRPSDRHPIRLADDLVAVDVVLELFVDLQQHRCVLRAIRSNLHDSGAGLLEAGDDLARYGRKFYGELRRPMLRHDARVGEDLLEVDRALEGVVLHEGHAFKGLVRELQGAYHAPWGPQLGRFLERISEATAVVLVVAVAFVLRGPGGDGAEAGDLRLEER
mmetsp:Transcript_44253/g.94941  ORF Transcript_44253/g.94941 Transcript_44253/m.94941 type:complete len:209 (-) Transcript_44253:671-1297(-)